MNWKVPPGGTFPLSNVCPSSLVIVWGTDDMFFQTTVVPALIVSVAGLKPKLPPLLSTISTTCVRPGRGVAFGVGVTTVGVFVTTDVVATGVGVIAGLPPPEALAPAPLPSLPQAASNIIKPGATASRPNQVNLLRPGWQALFAVIVSSF